MAWTLLPVDYTDAVWSGLRKYSQVNNDDGTMSFQDVTVYTGKELSFFGALDANKMNEALNTIMSMVENGTDLYEAFQTYFADQQTLFEATADTKLSDFEAYVAGLEAQGDAIIVALQNDYKADIEAFENTQEQVFAQWFDLIKGQLSTDAAGNLQNQITAHVDAEMLSETGVHGLRLYDNVLQAWDDATSEWANVIDEAAITRLESAVFNDITANPYSILFDTLDAVDATGVWDEAFRRIEC